MISQDYITEGFISNLSNRGVSGDTGKIKFFPITNRAGTGIKDPADQWVNTVKQLNELLPMCEFMAVEGYYGKFAEQTLVMEGQLPEGYAAFPANLPTRVIPAAYLQFIKHSRMFDENGSPKMACMLDVCPPPANKPWQAIIGGRPAAGNPVPLAIMLEFNKITLKFNRNTGELIHWLPGREKFMRGPVDCDDPWVLLG